jgi:hypothetical protein
MPEIENVRGDASCLKFEKKGRLIHETRCGGDASHLKINNAWRRGRVMHCDGSREGGGDASRRWVMHRTWGSITHGKEAG